MALNRDRQRSRPPPPVRHAALDYRPPLSLRLIRYGLIGFVGAAMAAVAYTIYWFVIATNLKDGIGEWIVARAGSGVQVAQGKIEIGGFPLNFRVIMTKPSIVYSRFSEAREGDRWEWRGQRLVADMAPWDFDNISVDLSGEHRFEIATTRTKLSLRGKAELLRIDADLSGDGLPVSVKLSAGAFSLDTGRGAKLVSAGAAEIFARRLFPDEATAKTPTFNLDLRVRELKLPPGLRLPLGNDITQFIAQLDILGRLDDPTSLEALAHWRDDGGIVELDRIEAKYGPLHVRANGTVAFDDAMQPMAAMTAKMRGFFPTIDALRRAGLIRSRDATMAKLILGALARRPKGGGAPSISLPLTIQNGKLFAGPVGLMDVPPIKWKTLPGTEGPRKLR